MEKVRVCFTSPAYSAYSETFIQNIKNGIEGDIFYCFGGSIPTESEDKELLNHLKPNLFQSTMRRLGIQSKPLEQRYFKNYLQKKKIDVIFANYGPSGARIAPVAKNIGIPLIVHFHGFDASIREVFESNRESYLEMFDVAKAIIVVSEEMKQDLITMGAPEQKLQKIIYAPNPDFLKIVPDFNSKQLLAIGRFVEKKAPYLTLLAYRVAKESCPDLKMKFVGTGSLLGVCRDLCTSFKILDVEFVGVLTPKEIRTEMSKSFCFVQHSKQAENGDKEGTPVAILEAVAAGLPIVSTKHAGIPEVVIEGKNGFLVEEGDIEMMAKRIIKIHQDRQLAEKFGEFGKLKIKQNHNSLDYFKSINELIYSSING